MFEIESLVGKTIKEIQPHYIAPEDLGFRYQNENPPPKFLVGATIEFVDGTKIILDSKVGYGVSRADETAYILIRE